MGASALDLLNDSFLALSEPQNALVKRSEKLPSPRELTPKQIQKRDEKWLFCSMVLTHQRENKQNRQDSCLAVAINHTLYFPTLIKSGKGGKSQLTYDNCRNWLSLMGKKGKKWDLSNRDALAECYATGSRGRAGEPRFWEIFNPLFLNPNQYSLTECRRLAMRICKAENTFADIPSFDQVKYEVKKWDKSMIALARYGEEYVKNNHFSYIDRDWSEVLVNDVWFADHRVFDVYIKDIDPVTGKWKAVRPWLCGFMDGKSWYMTSWQITAENPNNETIRNGLAWGISQHGRPANFYIDNGKDFLKQGFVTPLEFDGVEHSILGSLGIKPLKALPYRGRSKTIERSFKDHAETFCKSFASYLGNRPGARPEKANHYHKHPEELLTIGEFTQLFQVWLEDHHNRVNKGKILGGMTPKDAFYNGKRLERSPVNEVELFAAFLLPLPRLYKVRRGPSVNVNGKMYYGECLYQHYGEKLMVKTDRFDPEHVYVFESKGKPIGECKTRDKINALASTPEDRKKISEAMKFQNGQLKRSYTMLNEATKGLHLLSPQELLKLPADFDIVKLNSTNSVKGANHIYTSYKALPKGQTLADIEQAETETSKFDFKEDRKEERLAAFGEAACEEAQNEASSSPEELREFFKVAVQTQTGDEDYDY